MKICVDAMGGDYAPLEVVKGAVDAAKHNSSFEVILVGDKTSIDEILTNISDVPKNLSIIHASQKIEMHESPVDALKKKPDSSLNVCLNLIKSKEADAVVSCGNTGALVAGATITSGLMEGVRRVGLAVPIPTEKGISMIIDVGANVNCKPVNLLQYGAMARLYSKFIFNVQEPRIGLLNIGEETYKGNALVCDTFEFFQTLPMKFVGNIEGQNIFKGDADVIVCDGFVGNSLLKALEGFSETIFRTLFYEISKIKNGSPQEEKFEEVLYRMKKQADYAEYGGAVLLGIKDICLKSHGRSKAVAVKNCIINAFNSSKTKINDLIVEDIKRMELDSIFKWWPRFFRRG